MSCKIISFDTQLDEFRFGRDVFSWSELGAKIAETLKNGAELVDFGSVSVTVNYVTGMMRFAQKHGWFWDSFDLCTGDHDFDVNTPTPGSQYNLLQESRRYAQECRDFAHKASCAFVEPDAQYWLSEAQNAEQWVERYLNSNGKTE